MKRDAIEAYLVHEVLAAVFVLLAGPVYAQTNNATVEALVRLGFENVRCVEDDVERIFVIENNAYSLNSVGIGVALDQIMQTGLPDPPKSCSLIILDNHIPRLVLRRSATAGTDSGQTPSRADWAASYELDADWKKVKKQQAANPSLYKADLVIYPEFAWQNIVTNRMYHILLNISPSVEMSLWRGMKLAYQVIFPIVNDFGNRYSQIRPGFVTLSQSVRLPKRTLLTVVLGTFNGFRWGVDARAKHFATDRLWLEARLGYTGYGFYDNWGYHFSRQSAVTGTAGATYFWSPKNVSTTLRADRYLGGEYGVRADMMRHFRYASVGFYAMLIRVPEQQNKIRINNDGFNGGFTLQICIPPYTTKRKGYLPTVRVGDYLTRYNAGSERVYGQLYRATADDDYRKEITYNPFYITTELLNY